MQIRQLLHHLAQCLCLSFTPCWLMTTQTLPILQCQARALLLQRIPTTKCSLLPLNPQCCPVTLLQAWLGLLSNFVCGLIPQEVFFSLMLETSLHCPLYSL